MPKKRTQKIYFGEDQEKAVIRYLESETEEEKNKIFNEYLREPLIIMVESIIRRYKLYRKDLEFEEIHNDTISFLMTKINKFDYTKNHKAYSYFGTICKNYLMGAIQKDTKEIKRKVSYEDVTSELENRPDLVYTIDGYEIDYTEVITKLVASLEEFIEKEELSENEKKLGYALIEIFTNFDNIFQIGDGNKFNKNLILLSLREMTSLSTKEIRISMKKFKKTYNGIMLGFLN
jgi:DNA-directed RNA polymerase sigma subunit (sigma70/sigma32)